MLASRTVPKNGSRYKCAVPGCTSNSFDNLNVSFHKLPAPNKRLVLTTDYFGNRVQTDQLTAWISALKVPETLRHNHSKICSLHFKREDFYLPDYPTKSPTLLPTAVPSVNLPGSNPEKIAKSENRLRRRLNRREKKDQSSIGHAGKNNVNDQEKAKNTLNQVVDGLSGMTEKVTDSETAKIADDVLESEPIDGGVILANPHSDEYRGEIVDKGVILDHSYYAQPPSSPSEELHPPPTTSCEPDEPQAFDSCVPMEVDPISMHDPLKQSDQELPTDQHESCEAPVKKKKRRVLDDIESDRQLSTVCGIESFDLLNAIVKCVKFATKNKWESEDLMLDTAERVVMVYMKLKQKLSFSFLAFFFKPISETHCRRMFFQTLKVLSKCMKSAIPWPFKESILSNMPECFEKFENTRIVVDCTEIYY